MTQTLALMRFVKDSPLELGFRLWQLRPPTPSLTVVAKGTFDIAAGAPAPFADEQVPASAEVYVDDDVERPIARPSDYALLKPRGEAFVVGTAWAPGSRDAPTVACSFRIGPIQKSFAVFGDRVWEPGLVSRSTSPSPFRQMPLDMSRAYGGEGHEPNPWGRGASKVATEEGERLRQLPNLETPGHFVDSPRSSPDPVVVGALPMTWPDRMKYAGTYDDAYQRTRWPYLPSDFDPRFFLEAPRDQRLREGFFRGDERIEVEGLHPDAVRVTSRLPAIAPRVALDIDRGGEHPIFEEIPLKLDTVVYDAEHGQLLLTWRGLVEIPSESLDEIRYLFVAHDPLPGPSRSVRELQQRCYEVLFEEEEEEDEAEGEPPPEPDEPLEPEDGPDEDAEATHAQAEAAMAEATARFESQLAALGLPKAESPEAVPSPPDPEALFEQMRAAGLKVPPEVETTIREPLEVEEPEEPEPEEPEPEEPEPRVVGREVVEARLLSEQPLTDLDLTGADLSQMDLSRQDLSGSILADSSLHGCDLSGARLVGAALSGSSLMHAKLEGADLSEADLEGANIRGADLLNATLDGADFDGAMMAAVRLQGACAVGVSFIGANLEGSLLAQGDFQGSDFDGANLTKVNAVEANFTDASFEGVTATEAVFDRAVLKQLRAEGMDARGARFGSAQAQGSFWEEAVLSEADFSFADLSGADFSDAVLIGTEMDGCAARGARFDRANAHSLRARRSDLMKACFDSADLTDADFRGSNLFEAEFWRARTRGIQLATANVEMTKLA